MCPLDLGAVFATKATGAWHIGALVHWCLATLAAML
jgi:hypothetical protein